MIGVACKHLLVAGDVPLTPTSTPVTSSGSRHITVLSQTYLRFQKSKKIMGANAPKGSGTNPQNFVGRGSLNFCENLEKQQFS